VHLITVVASLGRCFVPLPCSGLHQLFFPIVGVIASTWPGAASDHHRTLFEHLSLLQGGCRSGLSCDLLASARDNSPAHVTKSTMLQSTYLFDIEASHF
jgi:hypothetical protein